jgi:hypothetical protein
LHTRIWGPAPPNHFKALAITFASTATTPNGVEYRGTSSIQSVNGSAQTDHIPVVVTYDSIAIYADTLTLFDDGLRFKAVGHVVIENGKDRTRVKEVTIDFGAEDPIRTLKTE